MDGAVDGEVDGADGESATAALRFGATREPAAAGSVSSNMDGEVDGCDDNVDGCDGMSFRNGWCSSAAALRRCVGSRLRHACKNARPSSLMRGGNSGRAVEVTI